MDFAWLLGLLHDIGRFEQVKRYNTFNDSQSVDHAELGADILFKEGLIDRFPTVSLPEGWPKTAETAIRQHNKLALPDGLDAERAGAHRSIGFVSGSYEMCQRAPLCSQLCAEDPF